MAIKIGVSGWALGNVYDPPFEESIEKLGDIGFKGIELIVSTESLMSEYYTEKRCFDLRKQIENKGMQVSQFVVYKDLLAGMALYEPAEKEKAYKIFEDGCRITRDLGSEIINTVSHWIPGLNCVVPYPPAYVYPNVPGLSSYEPKLVMNYPDFDWDRLWDNYIDSLKSICDIAANYGLAFALEGHPHVIVSHVDSFLRAHKEAARKNFGMNYDTSMQADQREHPAMSLRKLGKQRLMHMHVRDDDSLASHQVPVGMGLIDWDGVVMELKKMDFDGFLSIEISKYKDPVRWLKFSKEYLEEVIGRVTI